MITYRRHDDDFPSLDVGDLARRFALVKGQTEALAQPGVR